MWEERRGEERANLSEWTFVAQGRLYVSVCVKEANRNG